LSDEEARRRGTQKTVLERRSPPTFDVLIEIQTRDQLAVHRDVAASVDAMLRGYPLIPEIRSRNEEGEVHIQKAVEPSRKVTRSRTETGPRRAETALNGEDAYARIAPEEARRPVISATPVAPRNGARLETVRVYPYGVAQNRLVNAAKRLGVPVTPVKQPADADVLVTLRSYYRKRQRAIVDAEQRGMPVYVLRANTVSQMERFLIGLFDLPGAAEEAGSIEEQMRSTQQAINAVLNGERWVELPPASSYVRRLQHELVQQSKLVSHSYGKEPNRRVRIFRE
jgi:hypothetical protein